MVNSVTKDLRTLWTDVSNDTFKYLYNKSSHIDLYSVKKLQKKIIEIANEWGSGMFRKI